MCRPMLWWILHVLESTSSAQRRTLFAWAVTVTWAGETALSAQLWPSVTSGTAWPFSGPLFCFARQLFSSRVQSILHVTGYPGSQSFPIGAATTAA